MIDRHHLIHERVPWTSRPEARLLRETPSLVPRIDRELHNEIHRNCPPIPLLGYHALVRTLKAFEPTTDTLDTMGRLQAAIELSGKHPKSHRIERELGDLAVQAIDLQKPYLKGNTKLIF